MKEDDIRELRLNALLPGTVAVAASFIDGLALSAGIDSLKLLDLARASIEESRKKNEHQQ